MMHAGRKEGHCAPLFRFATALALSAGVCSAQTVDVAELEACAALETAAAKLACYDALTPTRSEAPAAAAVAPAPEPIPDPAPEPAAAPVADIPSDAGMTARPAPRPADSEAPQPRSSSDGASGPVMATVTRVTRDYRDRLEFHLASGQVWRQTEPRRFPYPKGRDFDVVITEGMMGDYRLRVGGAGPMVRIRQVE